MSNRTNGSTGTGWGIGMVALACLPCLGVALATSGALAVGGSLGNPAVILTAAMLAVLGGSAVLRRRGRDECCPSAQEHTGSDRVRDREAR